jgi:hypothetical protein
MTEDFEPLRKTLQRVFPDARLVPAAEAEVASLRQRYPGVPDHYLAFLQQVGYGSLSGSFMLYGGLVGPEEIFDPHMIAGLEGLVFIGDNFSGTLVGFDTRNGWRLVCVDDHTHEVATEEARTVGEFIARRVAEWDDA